MFLFSDEKYITTNSDYLSMGLESDEFLNDECGVLGIVGIDHAADYVVSALEFLQHRGQASAGVVSWTGERFRKHRKQGLVAEVFSDYKSLEGKIAIAHVRYPTAGSEAELQPVIGTCPAIAKCHNGDVTNVPEIKKILFDERIVPSSEVDVEYLLHIQSKYLREHQSLLTADNIIKSLKYTMTVVRGAYSVLEIAQDKFVAYRDPLGFKPLVFAEKTIKGQKVYGFASESSPLTQLGFDLATFDDVKPGEAIIIEPEQAPQRFQVLTAKDLGYQQNTAFCGFEYAYFADVTSKFNGRSVAEVRSELGKRLIKRFLAKGYEVDVITCIPDTARAAALGASIASGIPYNDSIIVKNRYAGAIRSFIEPKTKIGYVVDRKFKFNSWLMIPRIVIKEDSLVRGSTMKIFMQHAVEKLPNVKQTHLLLTFPMLLNPCVYGIDMKSPQEFMARRVAETKFSAKEITESASNKTLYSDILDYVEKQIADELDIDSVTYNTIDDYVAAVGYPLDQLCMACTTGVYPTGLTIDQVIGIGNCRKAETRQC